MKTKIYKKKLACIFSIVFFAGGAMLAQTTSDFENLTLAPNSYYDGSSGAGAFTSGHVSFQNTYNASWFYWDSGFAYSNQGDTTVAPSDYTTQLFETKAGVGFDSTANFAIGQRGAKLNLTAMATGYGVNGFYLTNTTYAYNSMKLGDAFGKKFGDTTGTHSGLPQGSVPDWFLLTIKGYSMGSLGTDSVNAYLADFRFSNDSLDYILKDWTWVDLTSLGSVDSLVFMLSSSDVGTFGMNTPAYFCMDNLITQDAPMAISSISKEANFEVFPNPASDELNIRFNDPSKRLLSLYNAMGELVLSKKEAGMSSKMGLEGLATGMYFLKVEENGKVNTIRIVKK
jgi:hypothetical protein